jgi:hypothetical protein
MPPKKIKSPSNLENKESKKPRCPNGQVRDKKTGECIPKKGIENKEPQITEPQIVPEIIKEKKAREPRKTKKSIDSMVAIMQKRKACIQKMRKKLLTKKNKVK